MVYVMNVLLEDNLIQIIYVKIYVVMEFLLAMLKNVMMVIMKNTMAVTLIVLLKSIGVAIISKVVYLNVSSPKVHR
jgi:hypothetical protein